MSDDRLRRLERERAAGPDEPLARARLLLEQVRSGVLPAKRLELAAAAGDVDSRRALGWPEHPGGGGQLHERTSSWDGRAWTADHDLASWVRRLASIEREAGLRAALAASEAVLLHSCYRPSWPSNDDEAKEYVGAVAAYVAANLHRSADRVSRDELPQGHLGSRLTFWVMLALTARAWDSLAGTKHLPTGAQTVVLCLTFLESLGCRTPREVLEGPISDAVVEWALRSKTPVELSPPGNGPEVRTVPGREKD